MDVSLKLSFLAALCFAGVLSGASLDQSIKQLPARHRIGVLSFSAYAKAADLKNGVLWYAIIGIGTALTTLLTAILVWRHGEIPNIHLPVYTAAACAVLHSICTSQAAPTYFKQKGITDEISLARLFNKFEAIQTVRSVFILLNFVSLIWAVSLFL